MKERLAFKIGDRVYYDQSFKEECRDKEHNGYGVIVEVREGSCFDYRVKRDSDDYKELFKEKYLTKVVETTKETSMDRIMKKLSEKGWSVTICGDWHGEVNDCYDEVIFRFNDKLALESWMFKRTIYHPISGKQVEISEESYQNIKKEY